MMGFAQAALAFGALALVLHLTSILVAALRCGRAQAALPAPAGMPAVSIIRPICGIDNFAEETLRSGFRLSYPGYELVFCVAHADDPAAALVRKLMREHPNVAARLLIGDDRISANPKLNNIIEGWREAAFGWVIMADSNVLMPRDYIQRLFAAWQADTGLACSPPVGSAPDGFAAEMECAFLNGYQARWQLFADSIGLGFAQGKTMLWRRADLNAWGGLRALGAELAEDAAATKIIRQAGHRVRLVDAPFRQPLGVRSLAAVWSRQVRWARLRRLSFPLCFAPEFVSGAFFPLLATVTAGAVLGYPPALLAAGFLFVWYGAEMLLVRAAGWPLSAWTPLAAIIRDLSLPVLWVAASIGSGFEWRGHQMRAAESAG